MNIYIWHKCKTGGRIQDVIAIQEVPRVGDMVRYKGSSSDSWCRVERVIWDHVYGESGQMVPSLETCVVDKEELPTFSPVNACGLLQQPCEHVYTGNPNFICVLCGHDRMAL